MKRVVPGPLGPGIFIWEVSMHIYWRIMEELAHMGEILRINDPSLKREFERWYARHRLDKIWVVYVTHDKTAKN